MNAIRSSKTASHRNNKKSVVVFTGHMIDKPGRATPRFPQQAEGRVAKRIAVELATLGATHGFASAASGGDILFHEAMLLRGGEVHVILPCAVPEFRERLVDASPGLNWGKRFEKIIRNATSVEILGDQCAADNSMASECCNRVSLGLGAMMASESRRKLAVLVFWDGKPGDAHGGTHSMVEFCKATRRDVINIYDLPKVSPPKVIKPIAPRSSSAVRIGKTDPKLSQQICAVVFSDVVGFSKVNERQFPAFARNYLRGVRRIIDRQRSMPLTKNTWGDGLYLVYPTVRDAASFALALRDYMKSRDWGNLGLPSAFSVRIGLHAGPVYRMHDPITDQWSYFGSEITRAARIEPIAKSGSIYATRSFAALASAEMGDELQFRFLGPVELPKNAGSIPLYEMELKRH